MTAESNPPVHQPRTTRSRSGTREGSAPLMLKGGTCRNCNGVLGVSPPRWKVTLPFLTSAATFPHISPGDISVVVSGIHQYLRYPTKSCDEAILSAVTATAVGVWTTVSVHGLGASGRTYRARSSWFVGGAVVPPPCLRPPKRASRRRELLRTGGLPRPVATRMFTTFYAVAPTAYRSSFQDSIRRPYALGCAFSYTFLRRSGVMCV